MSTVTSQLKAFIEESFLVDLDGPELTIESNLFEAGVIDSYGVVETVSFLEREFGVSFTDDELLSPKLASVTGMADVVQSKLPGATKGEGNDLPAVRPA